MSIEIIEKPTHKCSVCGCVFSYEKEDLVKDPLGLRLKDMHAERFLKCPVCDTLEYVLEVNVIKL